MVRQTFSSQNEKIKVQQTENEEKERTNVTYLGGHVIIYFHNFRL